MARRQSAMITTTTYSRGRLKWLLFLSVAAMDCGLAGIVPAAARPTASQSQPHQLHFARGANWLTVRGHLGKGERPVYRLRVREGQILTIRAQSTSKRIDSGVVPLLFVTPPGGKYDGEKTSEYHTPSSRAGDYRIEVAVNQMASNGREGDFLLRVWAR